VPWRCVTWRGMAWRDTVPRCSPPSRSIIILAAYPDAIVQQLFGYLSAPQLAIVVRWTRFPVQLRAYCVLLVARVRRRATCWRPPPCCRCSAPRALSTSGSLRCGSALILRALRLRLTHACTHGRTVPRPAADVGPARPAQLVEQCVLPGQPNLADAGLPAGQRLLHRLHGRRCAGGGRGADAHAP
jgi:hypothetical protein